MILETTYANKEQDKLINKMVGKPYGFLKAIRMKGIGSKRMIIDEVSEKLRPYINTVADINYANLELRPIGLLIHINKGLKNFTWPIPFYQLVIYKTDGSSIHSQGQFIKFRKNALFTDNKSFFNHLMMEKAKYDEEFNVLP